MEIRWFLSQTENNRPLSLMFYQTKIITMIGYL